ncbi:MAG: hypothetical protein HFI20_13420 [Lachnospiraceae bacterium]|jgi:hypothetical protein|nr:hypothetical protein [Lachnospiraceae bacterium]MCI9017494.1 hypothetical protein [Lachnospiraceae bacterium]MCI9680844.1 hypothetical protein [Lachnospiraceae bacterium]
MRTEYEKIKDLDAYTEQIIRQVEAEGLIKAPAHMKQEILERSERIDYQLAVATRKVSGQMQLFFYSLKVGAAVVTALFLLFMVPKEIPQAEPMVPKEAARQQEETLNRRLNNGMQEMNRMLNEMLNWKW